MSHPYTLVEYQCLRCAHRWRETPEWKECRFTDELGPPDPSPEERASTLVCPECCVPGKCVVRRKEDRNV